LTGAPVQEIITEAKSFQADLIIMGTRGASGLDRIFFGSNTSSVIENATCHVLAVPIHTKPAVPKKIVFATDYKDSDMRTLKELARVANGINAEILILHVSRSESKADRDMIEQFSKTVAQQTGLPQPYYYVMSHEDTSKGIDYFADSLEADLISLSPRKRSVFSKLFDSSLTKKMASEARHPLLAFHVAKN
jgi:nucleotide-binding universal stress UspA family protein